MKRFLKLITLIMIPVIIDQSVKVLMVKEQNLNITIIPRILRLYYVKNTGGAYGLLDNNLIILAGVNILLIVLIIKYLVKNYKTIDSNLKTGLLLILSGGISNLIDRLFRGYVIDYIDVTQLVDFPVFNIADSLIVIGAIIMIVTILISTIREQEGVKKG